MGLAQSCVPNKRGLWDVNQVTPIPHAVILTNPSCSHRHCMFSFIDEDDDRDRDDAVMFHRPF